MKRLYEGGSDSSAGGFASTALARMARMTQMARRLLADESGAEILEYVLIAGLIIAAAITTVATVGSNILARWTTVSNSSL